MAAVGCLEKEIQFQKEAIKEQGMRQAKDRLPTKIFYIRLKTLFFHQKHPAKGPPYACCPLLPASAMRIAAPPGLISPSDGSPFRGYGPAPAIAPARQHGSEGAVPTWPQAISPLPDQVRKTVPLSPFPRSRGEIASRTPKTGTCHPHQSKSFTGRGGPGEGDAFSKAPSSPGKYPASSVKTYAPASASASPAASSEAGPARGASATERSGICHCPGRGAVSSAFSPT